MDAARPPLIRLRGIGRWLVPAIPVVFLGLFLLYPLARILALGIKPLLSGGMGALGALAAETGLARLLLGSAGQALLSTALTLAVGLPAAFVFGRFDFPGKALLRMLLSIPFVLPTVVVASAFVVLVGPGGALERAVALLTGVPDVQASLVRTLACVLLAHVFYNVSIVVRIVGGAWANLDPRLRDTARTLGAGRAASFLRVEARLLVPPIAASALLVFAFCFSSFGVLLMLGGPRMGTLETEIYRQAVDFFNLPGAAFLAGLQLTITALVMWAYARLQARASVILNLKPGAFTSRKPESASAWALVAVCGILPTLGIALPMAALVAGSFATRAGPGFAYWEALFGGVHRSLFWVSPLAAAGNSLLFSVTAVALSLALGIPAAALVARRQAASERHRFGAGGGVDILFLLPLGTSAVTLGFGFIVALGAPPLDLRGSALLIPIAHALVALPLVVRSLLPALRSINPRIRQAAAILGAGPSRVRIEVDVPLLRRAFIGAAAFAFTVSLGEFAATALLTRPEFTTIPVLIYQTLSRPGEINQGQALALSAILMTVCGVGIAGIESYRTRGAAVF